MPTWHEKIILAAISLTFFDLLLIKILMEKETKESFFPFKKDSEGVG